MAAAVPAGLRDVIRMGRQHVRAGFIQVRQQKTGAFLEIPLHPALQEILRAHRVEHLTLLVTSLSQPFTPAGFTGWFRDRCREEAGLPAGLSAHGLRKAACRRLAEAGCSTNEIAAIFRPRLLAGGREVHQSCQPKTDGSGGNRGHIRNNNGKPRIRFAKNAAQVIELKRQGNGNGDPGRARTCGLPLRRRLLYPAELRGQLKLHFMCLNNHQIN
jgi:hypothetical protein